MPWVNRVARREKWAEAHFFVAEKSGGWAGLTCVISLIPIGFDVFVLPRGETGGLQGNDDEWHWI
jgi:hypothetical protein